MLWSSSSFTPRSYKTHEHKMILRINKNSRHRPVYMLGFHPCRTTAEKFTVCLHDDCKGLNRPLVRWARRWQMDVGSYLQDELFEKQQHEGSQRQDLLLRRSWTICDNTEHKEPSVNTHHGTTFMFHSYSGWDSFTAADWQDPVYPQTRRILLISISTPSRYLTYTV